MIEASTAEQPPPDICCLIPPSYANANANLISQRSHHQQHLSPRATKSESPIDSLRRSISVSFTPLLLALLCLSCFTLSNASVLPVPEAAGLSQAANSYSQVPHLVKVGLQTEDLHHQSSVLKSGRSQSTSSTNYLSQSILDPRTPSHNVVANDYLGLGPVSDHDQHESQRLDDLIHQLSKRRDALSDSNNGRLKRSMVSLDLDLVPAPTSHLGPFMKLFRHFKPRMVAKQIAMRKRDEQLSTGQKIGYEFLIPILVLLSGVFAGLTIGYMSLDDTQLQVLMAQGTEAQKKKAEKIMLVRKDPHRLLTTLLIANMCTNETLPIIAEPAFGGGLQAVIGSIVLVIVFAELIPQSVCARFGLEVGAYMAWPTRITMWVFWPVAYPVSRILHWTLGAHQGIIYRRGELKELVTMHAASGGRGGDLQKDTVMLVGGALDLQEKVVKEAMTPIEKVFMLPFTAKLDYPTLEKIVRSGHSRIPVYHEIEVPVSTGLKSGSETPSKRGILGAFTRRASNKQQLQHSQDRSNSVPSLPDGLEPSKPPTYGSNGFSSAEDEKAALSMNQAGVSNAAASSIPGIEMVKRKKILGTLLVKSCVLLDPEDAVPVSALTLNALPTVPGDEPLLNVLNVFQEGRSHMAIVSPRPRSVGLSRSIADVGSKGNLNPALPPQRTSTLDTAVAAKAVDGLGHIDEEKAADNFDLERASSGSDSDGTRRGSIWRRFKKDDKHQIEESVTTSEGSVVAGSQVKPDPNAEDEEEAAGLSANYYDEGLPIGIITMEDVLEELLQEEIYDEYDKEGEQENAFTSLSPPPSPSQEKANDVKGLTEASNDVDQAPESEGLNESGAEKRTVLQRLGIARKLSAKNSPHASTNVVTAEPEEMKEMPSNANLDGSGLASGLPTTVVGVDGSSQAEDYLNAKDVSSPASPIGSRPPTPSQTNVAFEALNSGNNPLASPGIASNRPVVIRKQAPGGQTSTSVVSEGYLRGRRPIAQGLGLNDASSSSGMETPPARSLTPSSTSQSRGNRFKSAPIGGSGAVTPGIQGLREATAANISKGGKNNQDQALDAQAAAAGSSNAPINLEESQASLNQDDTRE